MSVLPHSRTASNRLPQTQFTSRVAVQALDKWLIGSTLLILVLGAVVVWSATAPNEALTQGQPTLYFKKHLINMSIGVILGLAVVLTDYRWLRILTPLLYVLSVIGLGLVLLMGASINGSRSWVLIGGLSIQPAEFAKLAVICAMAIIVAERVENDGHRPVNTADVMLMLAVAALPAGLIMLQPDLGTVIVLSAAVLGCLAIAGAPRRLLGGLCLAGLAAIAAVLSLGLLKPYQVDRFLAFTDPSLDPQGAGYNTAQARIAIGNGGLTGQGLFQGSQTKAGFVPEQHTDFIFTVVGEELGLLGAALLIGLFGVLLWRALVIARNASDMFGRVSAAGIACWLGFQIFQSIGMCLGIMPVTGVPLPLVSYGGSSMFASMMAIGLLLNISLRERAEVRLGA
ncbi:MAG TPA: rod shape-determining protein RodA [Marmoricola sp.]|nr:rod shape-determining protein RodA [Nocardioidaceae bacterium]HRV69408.1 rod shape-determining protein RodA [Marmoricola sp.]